MATPALQAALNGDLTYTDTGAGGVGSMAGPEHYADNSVTGQESVLIEKASINVFRNPLLASSITGWEDGPDTSVRDTNVPDGFPPRARSFKVTSANGALMNLGQTFGTARATTAGEAWAGRMWIYHEEGSDLPVMFRLNYNGSEAANTIENIVVPSHTWYEAKIAGTASDYVVFLRVRVTVPAGRAVWLAGAHLEPGAVLTSLIPQYDDSDGIILGYSWASTVDNSTSIRDANSLSIPLALAPASLALRYSEDLGATWVFDYREAFGAIGVNGNIAHSGGNLVVTSTGTLLIGPIMAFAGTLTAEVQDHLEATTAWAMNMYIPGNPIATYIDVVPLPSARGDAPAITLA